ncbi:MAG TPA: SGNH/GDSL hydrolase family protein, partial [Chitinophagaceae bacterium]|nr:SGNH/GDSL hydrolase family protein [Chitinophagaceae bacterium]
MISRIVVLLILMMIGGSATGQTKDVVIAVMGSSTAEGAGAWPVDSSWVSRLKLAVRTNLTDGKDTIVYNLGKGGTTTYVGRENSFVPPSGYMGPDPDRNINKALSLYPNIILVNYPSNDVANNMPTKTTMDNYRTYGKYASDAGIQIIFLTPQPRNSVGYDQQVQLRDQKDSVMNSFAGRAINVWDLLVGSDGLTINPELSAGDGTHVNNKGHRLIFEQVSNFLAAASLPVKLSKFEAELADKKVELRWETSSELNNSHFIVERSLNARDFKAIGEVKGKGRSTTKVKYKFTDINPVSGKNFYRLKQVDLDGKSTFSQVIAVTIKAALAAESLYPVPATNSINLKIA